jgi:carbon-monoxide dehydrogenase small subunit
VTEHEIAITVNGTQRTATVEPRQTLADVLRDTWRLTGTHVGCEHGVCGACTVLVDGRAMRSCLMFAVQADGTEITTVEGIGIDGGMGIVQEMFQQEHGLQCGFCTPGFIVSLTAFLNEFHDPSEEELRDALTGNLCRCTGYQGILHAARMAAGLGAPTPAEAHL